MTTTRQDRILAGVALLTDARDAGQLVKAVQSLRVVLDNEQLFVEILDEFDNM